MLYRCEGECWSLRLERHIEVAGVHRLSTAFPLLVSQVAVETWRLVFPIACFRHPRQRSGDEDCSALNIVRNMVAGAGSDPVPPHVGGAPAVPSQMFAMSDEQMALLLNSMQGGRRRDDDDGEKEFRRAWWGIMLPTLKEGNEWMEWNFKWKTACAEAHPIIL